MTKTHVISGHFRQPLRVLIATATAVVAAAVLSAASPVQAATVSKSPTHNVRRHTAHRQIASRPAASLPGTVDPRPRTPQWWKLRHTALVQKAAAGGITTVFFGDSITEGMNEQLLEQTFGATATHFGIPGDSTQHLLWRMQHGELSFAAPAPKLAIILIGTNNLQVKTRLSPAERHDVFLGVKANVDFLGKTLPGTKVLVLGILPREASPQHPLRAEIAAINAEIATLQDNQNVWYADISKQMLEADGTLSRTVMSDLLHPTFNVGYERMFNAIKPYADKISH